jgi:hypothetical protein
LRSLLTDPGYSGPIEVDHDTGALNGPSAANQLTGVLVLLAILRCGLKVLPVLG